MASFTICRGLFAIFNLSSFQSLTFFEFLKISFYGIKFDLISVLIVNAIYIVIFLFPFDVMRFKFVNSFLAYLFLITNAIALASNYIDVGFFKFNAKRSTSEIFELAGGQTDITSLLPHFLKDYWFLIVIFVIHFYFFRKLVLKHKIIGSKQVFSFKELALNFIGFIAIASLTIIGIRGGLQLVPTGLVNATDNVKPEYSSIVLNTPFTIIKSTELNSLEEKNYFEEKELLKFINPIKVSSRKYLKDSFLMSVVDSIPKPNIVLIVVEGLSREFTKYGVNQKVTPFLDSLSNHSIVFENMFANGKRSVEGIPAITSSVLSLETAYINTIYSTNSITSIANQLTLQNYNTSFYHAASNGSMNFDSYCKAAGFEKYYGRNEYNNEAHYDGSWGTWDEEYLQYFAKELDKKKQPYFSTVFTLSSHHPFAIPDKYSKVFKKTPDNELKRAMSYTDFALKQFFKTVQQSKRFNNTIFLITADHTGITVDNFYYYAYGNYQIPFYLYSPKLNLKQPYFIKETFQQIDLLPLIMNLTSENKKYFSFGNEKISKNNLAITFKEGVYQLMNDTIIYQFANNKSLSLYNIRSDSAMKVNLIKKVPNQVKYYEDYIKAFIQTYNHALITNRMYVK